MTNRTHAYRFLRQITRIISPRFVRPKREIVITDAAIAVTLASSTLVYVELCRTGLTLFHEGSWTTFTAQALVSVIITFLIYGSLVYQFARRSYLKRRGRHRRASRKQLESVYDQAACRSLTILIPAYKEDVRVVFLTMMSAALQEYPKRRVVLLIDDPPRPKTTEDAARLRAMRSLPEDVKDLLEGPKRLFSQSLADFLIRKSSREIDVSKEAAALAGLYTEAAEWFQQQELRLDLTDHTEDLFARFILDPLRLQCIARARDIRSEACHPKHSGSEWIARHYRQLAALFDVQMDSFERKAYVNFSHAPNKAMNLNSYIGLVGKALKKRTDVGQGLQGGCFLEETQPADADFVVPDTDYFITLDADSLLSPDYALRLIHCMEQPENDDLAVIQTPYSAIPAPPGALENIAGATTDIQYVIHQGFTNFKATYWVGANATLRKKALLDIATEDEERGHKITKYIRDRTVIEDTESSIDLVDSGWQLYNYPERLSYSATPPDFGSLIIQRRRWANGGLIIVSKLLRYLFKQPTPPFAEGFMRLHYLTSILVVNLGLILFLATPLTRDIRTAWLPITALPYFFLYMRDLKQNGYRNRDMARVYALNLLLIPVNLAGVVKSIQQAVTNQKIAFGRTPKIQGRTAAPPVYILAEYALVAACLIQSRNDFKTGLPMHGVIVLLNTSLLIYAIVTFIGLRESKQDLLNGMRVRLQHLGRDFTAR